MELNTPGLYLPDTTLVAGPKTPVDDLNKQVVNFAASWDEDLSKLNVPSDRDHFAYEIQQLCRTIYQTIHLLSSVGTPRTEILQKVKQSLDLGRGQLALSLSKFKANEAAFMKASNSFDQLAASTSGRDFTPFTAPKLQRSRTWQQTPFKPEAKQTKCEVNLTDSKSAELMEEKKTQLMRCVDPTSEVGASFCLKELSKGLTKEQQRELEDFVPKAFQAQAVNDLSANFAALSQAIKATAKALFTPLYLGAVSETCLNVDPAHFDKCVTQLRDGFEGRNPEVNKVVKETMPRWVMKAGELIALGDAKLEEFDEYMVSEYRTIPGLIHEGCEGMIDAALPGAASAGIKLGKVVVRGASKGVVSTASAVKKFATSSTSSPAVTNAAIAANSNLASASRSTPFTNRPLAANSNLASASRSTPPTYRPLAGLNETSSAVDKLPQKTALG